MRYLNSTTQLIDHKKKTKKTIVNCHWQAGDFTRKTVSRLIHYIFLFFFIFQYSMGRLCQCRRHVSFWTYHKRSEWEIWLQNRGIPWGFSVYPGIAPDVICYRSSEALCNIWHPLGYRVQLLLLSYVNCSGRVLLPSTFLSKWNCHCWLVV